MYSVLVLEAWFEDNEIVASPYKLVDDLLTLLILRLKVEVAIEDILKVCHIKIPINSNVLAVICFLLALLYIGGDPVKIYFDIINFDIFNSIVAAMIIKLFIILPFIDSKVL
jgi:hypothetical protein